MRRITIPRLILLGNFIVSFVEAVALRSGDRVHNNDFKHLWLGTSILAAGGSPYNADLMLAAARQYGFDSINPFVYLPATGLLLRPLASLSFPAAEFLWFWGNWILAWLCVLAGPRLLKAEHPWLGQIAGGLFLAGSMPFMRQMTAGQMNVALAAILLGGLALLIHGRQFEAGAVIGLAAAFKITPIFLLLPLVGLRRWRAAISCAGVFALLNLLAALWAGWDVTRDAWPVIRSMGYGESTWAQFGNDFYRDPFNQSFNSLFHHLLTKNPYTQPWITISTAGANAATWLVSILLLIGLLAMIGRNRRRPYYSVEWREAETALMLVSILVMLLLPSIMWDHYAVQTLPALIWVFGSRWLRRSPFGLVAALITFFLLAYPWRHTAPEWTQGPGILLMPIRLWGTLALAGILYSEWSFWMKERLKLS